MRYLLVVLAFAAAACTAAPVPLTTAPPATRAQVSEGFVIAANPIAAEAGAEIIRRGGSAVDAAIAIEAMLSLVEPQSSGLGGGAFLHHFDARTGKTVIYDGRETAPAQASPTMFLDSAGKPLPFPDAVLSGRATGVPGVVKMLAMAHKDYGKLPWRDLFGSAERRADEGFIVSPRLSRLVRGNFPENQAPDVIAYFSKPDGSRVETGDRLRNPAYAEFLRRLAAQGPDAMYAGSTAARIVARTRAAPLGGSMTLADLADYRPIKREPVCRTVRKLQMCVPPPPASGVGLIQLMLLLERTDIAARQPTDPEAWYLFAEASRLMYADRDYFVGDPAFVNVPVDGLLAPAYLDQRARLIGTLSPTVAPKQGMPANAESRAADRTLEPHGTTHFIVRDHAGNVVSMTATVESIFGTGRMVDGFFLNNELTDFSFNPLTESGAPAANAVAPGKRPRSSMTPAILIDADGRFAGAIGSAGGNAILTFVAKSLVAAIDWGATMQGALSAPNLVARGTGFGGEVDKFPPGVLAGLAQRGVIVKPGQGEDSGVHGVLIRRDSAGRETVDGGYDPRREGLVILIPPPR